MAFSFLNGLLTNILQFGSAAGPTDQSGTGSPEGVVTAVVGSTFRRSDGGANTTLYIKESGSGNTGWVVVAVGTISGKMIRWFYLAGATWTKQPGLLKIIVTVIGGGGGSGGATATNASIYHYAGSGMGGGIAVSEVLDASLGATETVTIGAGGAAGAAAGGTGGQGGTTSFGARAVATGGLGGAGNAGAAGTSSTVSTVRAVGEGTTGNIFVGSGSVGTTTGTSISNAVRTGGPSSICFGKQSFATGNQPAVAAPSNTGTGALGAASVASVGVNVAGAIGGSGLVIIEEYYT